MSRGSSLSSGLSSRAWESLADEVFQRGDHPIRPYGWDSFRIRNSPMGRVIRDPGSDARLGVIESNGGNLPGRREVDHGRVRREQQVELVYDGGKLLKRELGRHRLGSGGQRNLQNFSSVGRRTA